MAFRQLLLMTLLTGISGDCTAGDENCEATYDGEDMGLAQIKAHTATKPAPNNVPCPTDIALDHGDSHGTLIDGDAGKLLVGTGQWKDCQAKCNENPDCVSWTMKYSAPANGEQHNCYLKKEAKSQNAKGDGAWSENWDVISGGSVVECYMTKGAPAINNADSDNYGELAIQQILGDPETLKDKWVNCEFACRDSWPGFECKSWTWRYDQQKCYGKGGGIPNFFTFTDKAISGAPAAQGANK